MLERMQKFWGWSDRRSRRLVLIVAIGACSVVAIEADTGRERFSPGTADDGSATQRFSLDFKDAALHEVFRLLAERARVNVIVSDDVEGRITLRLHETTWDEAVQIVRDAAGLELRREGNVILISRSVLRRP